MNLPCVLGMLYSCLVFPESQEKERVALRVASEAAPAKPAHELLGQLPEGEDVQEREKQILAWFRAGYFPSHQALFKPITVTAQGHQLTYWVSADYLALGSDDDSVLMPLTWTAAKDLVREWHMLIPTAKMVDQIFQQAEQMHWPHAYPPSDDMRSIDYLLNHNAWVHDRNASLGLFETKAHPLIAGHKKDLVVTPKLLAKPSKLAIYGWHNLGNGAPIQPQSLWHGKFYVDYSHGIRLVAPVGELDGQPISLQKLLLDPQLAPLLSFEGAFDICAVLEYACG